MMNAKKSIPVLQPQARQAQREPMGDEDEDFRRSGRVTFDDRGNAVWEWALGDSALSLENPSLSIAADQSPPAVHDNPLGTKIGYHPYESGKLSKNAAPRRKKDLRRLSESLSLKKQYEALKKADGSSEK
jgi:hypothetical protein